MSYRFFLPLFSLLILASCTEVELASHVAKTLSPQTPSQGLFKVGTPYKIDGKMYYPKESYSLVETGIASWYGPNFHGKTTANGEIFDQNELTAAHRTLQLPSLVRVTNLENGRSLIVRVNDRGPFSRGRILDLSKRSAELLGFKQKGTARVKVEVLSRESMAIAEAAKRGEDTGGVEVAMNESRFARPKPVSYSLTNDDLPNNPAGTPAQTSSTALASNAPVPPSMPSRFSGPVPGAKPSGLAPQPVDAMYAELEPASAPVPPTKIPGRLKDGNFYPDPLVQQSNAIPTNIFVQAGAFSDSANAYRHAESLSKFGQAQVFQTDVSGKPFYRVRFGPLKDVEKADSLLGQLSKNGQEDAIIVVVDEH